MLELSDEIKGVAQRASEPLVGPLRLGLIPTLCPYLLPWALPALRGRFPRLELICRETLTADAVTALRRRDLDAAILAAPMAAPGLALTPLIDEPFLLALPPGHRLETAPQIDLAALEGERLLVLEDGHCLRDHALSLCNAATPDAAGMRATSLETLLGLVAVGEGLTLAPAFAAMGRSAPTLRAFTPPVSRRIVLAYAKTSARRGEMRLLAETLRAAAPDCAEAIVSDYRRD
jgi:LysR family hydrogen peroxide-inducible transcriptional activator